MLQQGPAMTREVSLKLLLRWKLAQRDAPRKRLLRQPQMSPVEQLKNQRQ